jgi:hypothetical protein
MRFDIPGYPGHYVDDFDMSIWFHNQQLTESKEKRTGRALVTINRKLKTKASLLLLTFSGPAPTNKHVAYHKDNDCTNDALDNLEWRTHTEKIRRGNQHPRSKLTETDVKIIRTKEKYASDYAKEFNVHPVTIRAIWRNEIWKNIS